MTIAALTNRVDYVGNGVATVFAYGFKIFSDGDLVVTKTDLIGIQTTLIKGTDYTVSGVGLDAGGNVTLTVALTNLYLLSIVRVLAMDQPTNISNNSTYFAETHERVFDRLLMQIQQTAEKLDRSLKLPIGEAGSEAMTALASKAARANKYLSFDANGAPTVSTIVTPGVLVVSAYIQTLIDDANAAAARTTLGFAGAGGTVQVGNIEDNAVTGPKILDGAVTVNKIGAGAVTNAKIADDAVDAAKLKDDAAVDGNRSVTTNHVRDLAITNPKLADNAVTTAKIQDGQVTPAKLSAAVTAGDGTISWAKMKTTLVYSADHNWNQNGQNFEFETFDRVVGERPALYFFDVQYVGGDVAGGSGEVRLMHHVKSGDGTKEGKRFMIVSNGVNVAFNLKIYKLAKT